MTKQCWILTYDDETVESDQQRFEDVLNDFMKRPDVNVIDVKFTNYARTALAAMVIYEAKK
jgi:hypothetical protein